MRKDSVSLSLEYLYIGIPSEENETGFFSADFSKGENPLVFTYAFVNKRDAERFYGRGNFRKVRIYDDMGDNYGVNKKNAESYKK